MSVLCTVIRHQNYLLIFISVPLSIIFFLSLRIDLINQLYDATQILILNSFN